jgi:Ca2+-binding EF-hand superfamily protein
VDAFRRLFLHFDNNYNNSGKLTVNEVCQALAMVGEEGTPARVAELSSSAMELLGSDNQSDASSDVVDFDEFCEVWTGIHFTLQTLDQCRKLCIHRVFRFHAYLKATTIS